MTGGQLLLTCLSPVINLIFRASGTNMKAGCILSRLSRAELQRSRSASITSAAAQVGLRALMDVHKVTPSKRHIHNLVHRCAGEVFRLRLSGVSNNGNNSSQISRSKLTAVTQPSGRLIGVLDHQFWNQVIYSRMKSVPLNAPLEDSEALKFIWSVLPSGSDKMQVTSDIKISVIGFRLLV